MLVDFLKKSAEQLSSSIARCIEELAADSSMGIGDKTIFTEEHQQVITSELARKVNIMKALISGSEDPHDLYSIIYD